MGMVACFQSPTKVIVGQLGLFQATAAAFPSTFYGGLEFFHCTGARQDSRHCSFFGKFNLIKIVGRLSEWIRGLKESLTPLVEEWTRLPPSLATECLEAVERPDTTEVSRSLGGPASLSCVHATNTPTLITNTHSHPKQAVD